MTKKETTKQPRDGNGKFMKIPMIALHSKDGSTAYFTSAEDMEKFTKNNNIAFKEKDEIPKNPDCEPATKGYVKSLIRKTREHTHHSRCDGSITVITLCGGWLITFILGVFIMSGSSSAQELGNKWFIPFFLFSIAMTCTFCEFSALEVEEIKESTPTELYRYTPPRRDECEEE
jgi:hypothetical protein